MLMFSLAEKLSFEKWLKDRGCEILPITNEYETLRFKGKETGIFYCTGKTNNDYANKAYMAFKKNNKWDGQPLNIGRQTSYKKEKEKLIERDGVNCFLCGESLNGDITIEHLIALSSGGKNTLANMVLMHEKCNNFVKNKPINEKVMIAINKRTK